MEGEKGTVLIVDDDKLLRNSFGQRLSNEGYEVLTAATGEEGLRKLSSRSVDLVLLDIRLPGRSGLDILGDMKSLDAELPVIFITAHGTIETAVEAVKNGAYDYLTKPVEMKDLLLKVGRSLETRRLRKEVRQLRRQQDRKVGFHSVVHRSVGMKKAIEMARQLAQTDKVCILLEGETGTGKDLLARAIHFESPRADRPFLEITCSAVPHALLESELFGYEKGAFTDASSSKEGLLELADAGTLFLNEIGDMDSALQAKVLAVLEAKPFRRVGGVREVNVDVRIIAATNQDLRAMVSDGRYRRDLYHRLNVVPVHLPPLRDRKEDLLLLASYFLEELRQELRKELPLGFSEAAEKQLLSYEWPGNVRELRNVIERAVILCSEEFVLPRHLRLDLPSPSDTSSIVSLPEEGVAIEDVERQLLLEALKRTDWNQSQAAALLRTGRDALRYRMKKFKLL